MHKRSVHNEKIRLTRKKLLDLKVRVDIFTVAEVIGCCGTCENMPAKYACKE